MKILFVNQRNQTKSRKKEKKKKRSSKFFMSLMPTSLLLLLLLRLAATVTSASPPPPPPEEQLNNIIDALIGAGDFNSWANMLSAGDTLPIPLWATFFVPSDSQQPPPPFDQMMAVMAYHIVPQRLSFSQLSLMKPHTHLPTLVPSKSITISNNSLSNFTLDHSLLSHPDLYLTSSFAVHGIQTFLDYPTNTPFPLPAPPPPPPQPPQPLQAGFTIGSHAASLGLDLTVVFLLLCVALIQDLLVV